MPCDFHYPVLTSTIQSHLPLSNPIFHYPVLTCSASSPSHSLNPFIAKELELLMHFLPKEFHRKVTANLKRSLTRTQPLLNRHEQAWTVRSYSTSCDVFVEDGITFAVTAYDVTRAGKGLKPIGFVWTELHHLIYINQIQGSWATPEEQCSLEMIVLRTSSPLIAGSSCCPRSVRVYRSHCFQDPLGFTSLTASKQTNLTRKNPKSKLR